MSEQTSKRHKALPHSLPPRGLRRAEAAAYIGVAPSTFERMMLEGFMPHPKRYKGCVIWDRSALDEAFACLPEEKEAKSQIQNPWDMVSNE